MNNGGMVTVEAVATNSNGTSADSLPLTFTIILTKPSAPSNFKLAPNDDTGIVGDNITSVREPSFIGTTVPNATVELFQVGSSTVWDTTTADANGNFSVQLPFDLTNGQISLYVEVVDLAGNTSPPSNTLTITIVSVASDYNGDGYSDPALYVRNTTTNQGQWLVQATTPPAGTAPPIWFTSGMAFGPANAVPFQGDFDGDGKADLAYYQLNTATWVVEDSKTGGVSSFVLGTANSSVPVVGYFDANAPEEMAVFTIVNGQGVWSIASGVSPRTVMFGQAGDIPDPGNYDGLGYDQLAVYRPSTGQFLVLEPNGTTETLNLGVSNSPDLSSLVPVPGAYDNLTYFNDNESERTEAAVYDPKVGTYTILGPGGNTYTVSGFLPGDIPAPADYFGSGSTQPAVFRSSTGQFIGAGGTIIATFGQSGDIPLAAPLSYRMPSSDPPTGGTGTGTTGTGTGTGTTGTGTGTGTGTTGTGTSTTGTGTTGTGTTGTGTGTTGNGTGSSSSSGSHSSSTPPPAPSPGTGLSHAGSTKHKKPVVKHKPKPVVHHKKPTVHKKVTVVQHHATKAKVQVVTHKVTKVVTAASVSKTKSGTHLVDLALEDIHTNLRRSSSKE